ncbi:conserved hypothetical protein [Coccidioides posadasii str. Silveira]|uniref:Uncharacterized protein n=1 Tax=Coccidioides posadasii (strain RMSCC 757 / Silveira) TaxID=443226 RepID=E9DCA1_COCPS|nr:conserved hypothetical protein [Coccidioides posadasii str. Silveira]
MSRISPDKPREIWRIPPCHRPLDNAITGKWSTCTYPAWSHFLEPPKKSPRYPQDTRMRKNEHFLLQTAPGGGGMKRSLQNEGACRGSGRAARAINVILEAKAIQKYSR